MSEIDKDLQRRLKGFAEGISPEPGRSALVVRSARRKRRLVALSAGLAVVVAIGGLAGATTLLADRDRLKPAPGPEETSECVATGYDAAVFIEDATTESEIQKLRESLAADAAVDSVTFMSKKAAFEEFKEHYADQPEFWENLPEDALPMSFRVTLRDDADLDATARRFKTLDHVEAVRTRGELSKERAPGAGTPGCPSNTFARYSFEVAEGDASASGVLEVSSEDPSICLSLASDNILASHLLWLEPGRLDHDAAVLTFFDPHDGEEGPDLPPTGPHCFAREQLSDLRDDGLLQRLVDAPAEFRIDFHRGPDDEPGLVAELVPVGEDDPCATGPSVTDIPTRTVTPGERVTFSGRCFQDLRLHRKTKVFLTATVDEDGHPIGKTDLGAEQTCELIAEPESNVRIFQDGLMRGWLIVPHNGTCFREQFARTHVPLGVGTYQVAVGCRACGYANLRVDPGPTSSALAGVRTLVTSFMQRRVEGAGAQEFLDRRGRAHFRAGGYLAPLYPDPPLQDFQIEFVDDVGNEAYEVGVSLVFQQGRYGETLFVRERNGELVISGGRPGVEGP